MSKRRKRKGKALPADANAKPNIHSVFISHPDDDHQQAFSAGYTRSFYGGSFAGSTVIGTPQGPIDAVFVDESGVHMIEVKAIAPKKVSRKIWTRLPTKTRTSSVGLPTSVLFILILMSRARRNDVLNDIMDWYPGWVTDKGPFGAYLACWWKIGASVLGGLLDLLQRIGEIVGKFRGAK